MSKSVEVIIKSFIVRDRHFTIVRDDEGFYQAIEDKFLENGRLTKTLYGHQTMADRDLQRCLTNIKNVVEIDYLVKQGHSKAEAFGIVFDLIGKIEMSKLEEMFA